MFNNYVSVYSLIFLAYHFPVPAFLPPFIFQFSDPDQIGSSSFNRTELFTNGLCHLGQCQIRGGL
jgi:hypothetical protein